MQDNNHKGRRTATDRSVGNPVATMQCYTAEQRETLLQGSRIPARIIARAHLGCRAEHDAPV